MSRLNDLINELCPDGVEYRTIKETAGVNRGIRLTKKQLSDEYEYNVYHGSKDTPLGKYKEANAPANTTIVVNTGGIGGVKFLDEPFWCSDGSFWLGHSPDLNDKFLYYSLSGYENYFLSKKRIGGVPTIDRSVVENFRIPVPPLEVQREIVRILDNFTFLTAELTTELTAELTARKKQYEGYIDKALTFGPQNSFFPCEVEYIKISDLGSIRRGKRFVHADSVDIGIPCIHYGELYTFYGPWTKNTKSFVREDLKEKLRYARKNDVVIVGAGENDTDIGVAVAYLGEEEVAVHDACYILTQDNDPEYISYCLRTSDYHKQIRKYVSRGKICAISSENIGKATLPIPPLEIQRRIVEFLNQFNGLCNDFQEVIPAEIEARQKQYEYYRDKLLSFKEKES